MSVSSYIQSLKDRPNLSRAITNIAWLLFDKVFRLGLSFLITLWLARYLAPEFFGVYNYAIAFVALFSVFASLGLNSILVQLLVQEPSNESRLLGSSFFLQFVGGFLAFILSVGSVYLMSPQTPLVQLSLIILSATNLFRLSDTVRAYFEAKVQSKKVVIAENLVFLFVALTRVLMIVAGLPLLGFVFLLVGEAVLTTFAFLFLLGRHTSLKLLKVDTHSLKRLASAAWPLALSSMAIMLYMRVDQLMLGVLIDQRSVGIYSAAVRISEIWYFLPTILVASVFPRILQELELNQARAGWQVSLLLLGMSVVAVLVSLLTSFFAPILITFLYGEGYQNAAPVLTVHIWSSVFVFAGVLGTRWLLAQSMQRFIFMATVSGAVCNIALNYFFIPLYGPVGAAWATLIAQLLSSVLINVFHPKARKLFWMQVGAISFATVPRVYVWVRLNTRKNQD